MTYPKDYYLDLDVPLQVSKHKGMKTKPMSAFLLEEYSALSPRSQYLAELTFKATGEVILIRNQKGKYKILKGEDVLLIK